MNKTIGVLDSGLGGYSVLHALQQAYPGRAFCFVADQRYAPYGDKEVSWIAARVTEILSWFMRQGIRTVVIACNTISSTVLPQMRLHFPEMELIGIISLTCDQVTLPQGARVAVLATRSTTNSGAYQKYLSDRGYQPQVVATPQLVPLIESLASDKQILAAIRAPLAAIAHSDLLLLGCTHYPLIARVISQLYQQPVLDSRLPVVHALANYEMAEGATTVLTSGSPQRLYTQVNQLFGDELEVHVFNSEVEES